MKNKLIANNLDENFFRPDRSYNYLKRLGLKKATMSELEFQMMMMRNWNLMYHTVHGGN